MKYLALAIGSTQGKALGSDKVSGIIYLCEFGPQTIRAGRPPMGGVEGEDNLCFMC